MFNTTLVHWRKVPQKSKKGICNA